MLYRNSHRQNRYFKQIIIYGILFFILIIFMATIGLDLLIQTSHFFASVANKQKNLPSNSSDEVILSPQLFNLPSATNSAQLVVAGQGQNGTRVTILVNDKVVDEQLIDNDTGDFETTINLDEGANSIYAVTEESSSKRSAKSSTYVVSFLKKEPLLVLTNPADNIKVYSEEITVSGKTDPDSSITINSRPTVVDSEGNFVKTIILNEGANLITIQARNIAGSIKTEERHITYEKD